MSSPWMTTPAKVWRLRGLRERRADALRPRPIGAAGDLVARTATEAAAMGTQVMPGFLDPTEASPGPGSSSAGPSLPGSRNGGPSPDIGPSGSLGS